MLGAQPGRRHDARRLRVADGERHVGTQHQPLGSKHADDELQHPGVERKGEASAVLDQAQRGKSILRLGDGGQQVRRHQMGMGIDDHPWLPSPAPATSSWPGEPL
ncbi:MAG: hypothetical protein ACJ8D9_04085 [Xanthobacteraceae bacterium]